MCGTLDIIKYLKINQWDEIGKSKIPSDMR